jgi:hypothetical protein
MRTLRILPFHVTPKLYEVQEMETKEKVKKLCHGMLSYGFITNIGRTLILNSMFEANL